MAYVNFDPDYSPAALAEKEQQKYLLLLECQLKNIQSPQIDFDLNVIFNPIEVKVREGIISKRTFYFGIRRAQIEIKADGGNHLHSTSAEDISTTLSATDKLDSTISFKSGSEISGGVSGTSLKLGSESGEQVAQGVATSWTFTHNEKPLTKTITANGVSWEKALPQQNGTFRNLLEGNLNLNATFKWPGNGFPKTGKIVLKPKEFHVYDEQKQITEKFKVLAMLNVIIHKYGIVKDPMTSKFTIQ